MHSALKHEGRPLYAYARAGIEVERAARHVVVHAIAIVEGQGDTWTLDVRCSKGTYVRTLAEDIAKSLGTCGHVEALRRVYVEPFDRAPMEIVQSNIRFSLQPVDAPPDPAVLNRLFDHMQSDELILFSTDYPHWQFEGEKALPDGLSADLVRKIMIDNPYATYERLKQSVPAP